MKASVRCMKKRRYWYYLRAHTYTMRNDGLSNTWHRMPGIVRVSMNNEHHIHTHEWNRIAWNDMQNHISSTTPPPPTTTACNAILLHISTHHISFITFHCHRCLRRHRHRRRHHHHHPQPHYHRTIKLVLPVISNKPLDTFWNPWIASIA